MAFSLWALGVDALVQSAEKACDLARANWRTSDLRDGSTAKLRVFGLAKMASSQAVGMDRTRYSSCDSAIAEFFL
jgi:hypothetical protein